MAPLSQQAHVTILDSPPPSCRPSYTAPQPKSESPGPEHARDTLPCLDVAPPLADCHVLESQTANQGPQSSILISDTQPSQLNLSLSSTQISNPQVAQSNTPENHIQGSMAVTASAIEIPKPLNPVNSTQTRTSPRDVYEIQVSDVESSQELPKLPKADRFKSLRPPRFEPVPFDHLNSPLPNERNQSLNTSDIGEPLFDWPKLAKQGDTVKNNTGLPKLRGQALWAHAQRQHSLPPSHDTALSSEDLAKQGLDTKLGSNENSASAGPKVQPVNKEAVHLEAGNDTGASSEFIHPPPTLDIIDKNLHKIMSLPATIAPSKDQANHGKPNADIVDQGERECLNFSGGTGKSVDHPHIGEVENQRKLQLKEKSKTGTERGKAQEHPEKTNRNKLRKAQKLTVSTNAKSNDQGDSTIVQSAADRKIFAGLEKVAKPQIGTNKDTSIRSEKSNDEEELEKAEVIRAKLAKINDIKCEVALAAKAHMLERAQRSVRRSSSVTGIIAEGRSEEPSLQGEGDPGASTSLEIQQALPSALRVSPSNSRRTVSSSPSLSRRQVTFADPPVDVSTKMASKARAKLDEKSDLWERSLSSPSEKEPSRSTTFESKGPSTRSKAVDRRRNSAQKVDSCSMVQSRLNVTKKVVKGKDRVLDQPSPIKRVQVENVNKDPNKSPPVIESVTSHMDKIVGPSKHRSITSPSRDLDLKKNKTLLPPTGESSNFTGQNNVPGSVTADVTGLDKAGTGSRTGSKSISRSPAREIISSDSSSYESSSESEEMEGTTSIQKQTLPIESKKNALPVKGLSGDLGNQGLLEPASSSSLSDSDDKSTDQSEDEFKENERSHSTSNREVSSGAREKRNGTPLRITSVTNDEVESIRDVSPAKMTGSKTSLPTLQSLNSFQKSPSITDRSFRTSIEDEAGRQLQREARQSSKPQSVEKTTKPEVESRQPFRSTDTLFEARQAMKSTPSFNNRPFPSLSGLKATTLRKASNQSSTKLLPDLSGSSQLNPGGHLEEHGTTSSDRSSTESSSESDSTDNEDRQSSNGATQGKKATGVQSILKSKFGCSRKLLYADESG